MDEKFQYKVVIHIKTNWVWFHTNTIQPWLDENSITDFLIAFADSGIEYGFSDLRDATLFRLRF
jgi:hypothetical protein